MVPYIIEALNTIPAIRNANVDDSDTNYTKLLNKLTEVRLVHDFIREASDVFDFTGGYSETGAYRGKFFDIMNNLSNNKQWFEVDSNGRLVVSDEDFERTFKAKSEKFTTEEHKQLLDYFLNKIRSMRADLVTNPETSQFKMFNFGAQMDSNFVRNISDYFKNWVDKLEVVSNMSSKNPLHREDLNAARSYLKELFAPMRQALSRTKNTNDFLKQFLFTGEFVRPLDFNYSKLVENDSPIVLRSTQQERMTTRMQKNVRDLHLQEIQ